MDGDSTAQFIYLAILLGAGLFWFGAQSRINLNKTLQYVAIWGFIFIGVIAAYGMWGDIRSTLVPQQSLHTETGQIQVPRARDGHYYLTLDINKTPVRFLVDTGATQIVLSQSDAKQVGIDLDALAYLGRAQTANGMVRTAQVRLMDVALGDIADKNIRAYVNEGDLDHSLLGMSYLQKWRSIEIRNNALVLTR